MMKRFNKAVEDVLLGKYGIAWNRSFKCYHHFYISDWDSYGCRCKVLADWDFVEAKLLLILGILEYEYRRMDSYCKILNEVCPCKNEHKCKLTYELSNSMVFVRAEINRVQGLVIKK